MKRKTIRLVQCSGFIAFLAFARSGLSADVAKAPVPNSPYIAVVYRFADTLIERGRDIYGPQKTGLFLSALDRRTLGPLTNRPPPPAGIRESDRVAGTNGLLVGANPQHDENLLRLLLTLSELSGKPKYREAAEIELKWLLQNAGSPATDFFLTGASSSWDVMTDTPIASSTAREGAPEFFRPWMLWDRCFDLASNASSKVALSLREYPLAKPGAQNGIDSPRQVGFVIRAWAVAYARTKDEQFLKAMEGLLAHHENSWGTSTLSLAIDCDGAAHRVPEPLASRLRAFAGRQDEFFCSLSHDLKNTGGFLTGIDKATGALKDRRSLPWIAGYSSNTTAQIGMNCVSRYENTAHVGYRELVHAAADLYLKSRPGDGEDTWPMAVGHAISLELAAWRSTARPEKRARDFADFALQRLFADTPLPRASLRSDHYESITGADTLALALTELHLQILHITAVRCPPNTVDR